MAQKYFNFNNEADLTPVEVDEETGHVSLDIGDRHSEFESVQEFAEFYAVARNVKPENLKNWVLTEDGDQFAFVLRAGTAGLTADEIREMSRGLRNAGMSPAEIGEAIAAASSRDEVSDDNGVDMTETPRTQIVRDYLENASDETIDLLRIHFEESDIDRLVAILASDASLFEDESIVPQLLSSSPYTITLGQMADEDDDDDDDDWDDDRSEEENFDDNIRCLLDEIRSDVAQAYPVTDETGSQVSTVPLALAIELKLKRFEVGSDETARVQWNKASVAAQIAGRQRKLLYIEYFGDDRFVATFKMASSDVVRQALSLADNAVMLNADNYFALVVNRTN